jgi:large subunit ribosomal protein L22
MSPTKVRQVVDLIRGRHVDEAKQVLAFTQRGATLPVRKVLESAIANAEHNRSLAADELFVARAWVDEGPTLRRFRPRAMGRATRINKRTCHISVVVGRPEEVAPAERPTRKTTRRKSSSPGKKTTKKTTAKKTTAKKTTAKTTSKKTTAKKTTAKKTTAKKTTAKKTTSKKQEGEST